MSDFAFATPTLALKEAFNCGGCHNPGRSQREFLWRRCTLDCQGCHVDPNGGAARNRWGYYYSHDQLASLNLFKPLDPLKIDDIVFAHYDGRIINRKTHEFDRTIPMAHEWSLRLRLPTPILDLHVSRTLLYMGRLDEGAIQTPSGKRLEIEKSAIQIDALPMNLYLRAARGQPVYGLRRPNHSLWIRERIGLDQFAITDSISFGGSPNVPFMHFSQILGNSELPDEEQQKGQSYHVGVRGVSFGWHLNYSGWKTKSQKASINMSAIGTGANFFGVILQAERNFRRVEILDDSVAYQRRGTGIHPSSIITEGSAFLDFIPGVLPGIVRETYETDRAFSERLSYVLDFHPIPFVQFEYWYRKETGKRLLNDTLAVFHLYADL